MEPWYPLKILVPTSELATFFPSPFTAWFKREKKF